MRTILLAGRRFDSTPRPAAGLQPWAPGLALGIILAVVLGSGPAATAQPTNQAPLAQADSFLLGKNEPLVVAAPGLLANDSDLEGDSLTTLVASLPAHGLLQLNPDGSFTYRPASNYFGADSFTYVAMDATLLSAPAEVTLTITNLNRAPVAAPDSLLTSRNQPLTAAASLLLANDRDLDGDPLSLVPDTVPTSNGGQVTLTATNMLFIPPTNYAGLDAFAYVVEDPFGARATGVVSVVVAPPELAMVAGTNVFNPQTGLFEQRVAVTNTGVATVAAVRVLAGGLPTGVRLWNASGTNEGLPYVQHNSPLNPGAGVRFTLEYYVPDRAPFDPILQAEAVLAAVTVVQPAAGVAVTNSFIDLRQPGNSRFVIEFATLVGRSYTVLYSQDLTNWHAATPSLTATSTRTQWYDDGPPKTPSKPASSGSRFYRVLLNPANP